MTRGPKEEVQSLVEEEKFGELAELVACHRGMIRYLNRLLCHTDEIIRRRAVEAMGEVAFRLSRDDPGAVRNIIRNQLWSINEESGGIGWSAPECIGEIIYRLPEMFGEFASIVLSFTDEPMLRRGVVWAAGRIARAGAGLVRDSIPDMASFLEDPDPVVRGYAVIFMKTAGQRIEEGVLARLKEDTAMVPVYEKGSIRRVKVSDLARS